MGTGEVFFVDMRWIDGGNFPQSRRLGQHNYKKNQEKKMSQKRNIIILAGLTILLVLVGSTALWAKDNSRTMKIYHPTVVGQTTLAPGEYSLQVADKNDSAEISFYNKSGKLVGQATAQIVKAEKKQDRNQMFTKNNAAKEMVMTGLALKGETRTYQF